MTVHWVAEDPDRQHEGHCELVDADGQPWPNPNRQVWWTLLPANWTVQTAGLRAACACGWHSPTITPLILREGGAVDDEATENECLTSHRTHVRDATETTRKRDIETFLRITIDGAAAAELSALNRLALMVATQHHATRLYAPLVAKARAEGADWADIGRVFGVSRQAAQQRYGTPPADRGH